MIGANLIPKARLARKKRNARLRLWGGFFCFYVLLLATAIISCGALWATPEKMAAKKLDAELRKTAVIERSIEKLKSEAQKSRQDLEARQAIRDQPDWSILLALLSDQLGDEVVLNKCGLSPVQDESSGTLGSGRDNNRDVPLSQQQYRLNMAGFGRTQIAVSQFVLSLEQLHLFRDVRLVKVSRQPFLDGQAIAFSIECSI